MIAMTLLYFISLTWLIYSLVTINNLKEEKERLKEDLNVLESDFKVAYYDTHSLEKQLQEKTELVTNLQSLYEHNKKRILRLEKENKELKNKEMENKDKMWMIENADLIFLLSILKLSSQLEKELNKKGGKKDE
jgi:chromosome segregation ATPase